MSPTAKCYELFHENMPIGFCAVIFSPKNTGDAYKRIHRIVIHPDWQGIGLGRLLATRIAHMENGSYDVFLQTSNPAMKKALLHYDAWRFVRNGFTFSPGKTTRLKNLFKTLRRVKTASFVIRKNH